MAHDPLLVEDRRKIEELLLHDDWVQERTHRADLKRLLRDFHPELHFPDADGPADDVARIVRLCADTVFGLHCLVEVLEFHPAGKPVVEELRRFIHSIRGKALLSSVERQRLQRAAARFPAVSYVPLFDSATGGDAWPPGLRHDLVEILLYLEQLTTRIAAPPPLLVFIAGLAEHPQLTDPDVRNEFEQVLTGPCGRLPVDRQDLAAAARVLPHAGAGAAEEAAATLVVRLKPDPLDDDTYVVSAWLQRARCLGKMLVEEQAWSLAELPQEVDRLLAEEGDGHAMPVEFILPRALFNEPVDKWTIGPRNFTADHPLGSAHPVVIRSLERLTPKRKAWKTAWAWKWGWIREHGHEPRADAYEHVDRRVPAERMEVLLHALGRDVKPACVVLHFTPPSERESRHDELTVALSTGVPIAVWRRDSANGGTSEQLRTFVDRTPLADLPRKAFELRTELSARADRNSDQLGHHLVLLYDDHDRPPEAATTLAAPERKN